MPNTGYLLGVRAIITLCLCLSGPSQSLAQEWTLRVKPRGVVRIVDLMAPDSSAWQAYGEGLVNVDKDNNHVACLARDWRWVGDRAIEFRLREGVRFQNGERFDAEALKTNWEAYKEMEQPRYIPSTGLPDETVFEIIDDYRVRFTFPEPDAFALVKFRWFIQIAPAFLTNNQFKEKNWARLTEGGPWGTGPFRLVKGSVLWGSTSPQVILEANEDYWDERYPRVKRVVFENSLMGDREEAVRLCMDEEGDLDIVTFLRPLDTLKVAESRYAKVVKNKALIWFGGYFNQRKKDSKWRDLRLREAVNYAINREELQRYGAKGNAYNLGAPLAGVLPLYPEVPPFTYDTKKAKSLLAAAGYPDGFEVHIITHEAWKLEAHIIGTMLERIGMKVKLDVLRYPDFVRKRYIPLMEKPPEEQEWDVAIAHEFAYAGLGIPFFSIYLKDNDFRMTERAPMLERMFEELAVTVDPEGHREKLRAIANYVHKQAMNLEIYSPMALYAVNKQVDFVPYQDLFLRLKEISLNDNHWSIRDENN